MARKRVKLKRKSKHKKNKTKTVPTNDNQPAKEEIKVQDEPQRLDSSNIKKKQDKYKKLRKNMGKALRYSWKCLVVGLQNLSTAYSMPLGVGATIVPDIQRAKAHI
ncbi:hypothetical protein QQF64_011593 [Cirrhinus molitorella]|uniref:Uncharacterized protein n=1 Tax=Cirrhinus molitorella TaxID=172907 RepID=A0ABR3LZQ3_9TELE